MRLLGQLMTGYEREPPARVFGFGSLIQQISILHVGLTEVLQQRVWGWYFDWIIDPSRKKLIKVLNELKLVNFRLPEIRQLNSVSDFYEHRVVIELWKHICVILILIDRFILYDGWYDMNNFKNFLLSLSRFEVIIAESFGHQLLVIEVEDGHVEKEDDQGVDLHVVTIDQIF